MIPVEKNSESKDFVQIKIMVLANVPYQTSAKAHIFIIRLRHNRPQHLSITPRIIKLFPKMSTND